MGSTILLYLGGVKGIITVATFLLYLIVLLHTSYRIIMDVKDSSKALAYILLIYILPLAGLILYQILGINLKKNPLHTNKLYHQKARTYENRITKSDYHTYPAIHDNKHLIEYLSYKLESPLLPAYSVEVLINGEEKYSQLLKSLEAAKQSIHILYYIFEDDEIGQEIEKIISKKAKQGVKVRFIFDDFGSNGLHKAMYKRLQQSGVEIYPFYPFERGRSLVRLNNRNHRKIIVIDGKEGYVGGINVSKSYDNRINNNLYWRDTHLRLTGPIISQLQYIFLYDWNYCSKQDIQTNESLFPIRNPIQDSKNSITPIQIVTSGPDSDFPTILNSIVEAINSAQEQVNITTPYLIPDAVLLTALTIAAHRGVNIKILLPLQGDSKTLTLANASYFQDLLESGIEVYLYKKGFIHAKTITVDQGLSIIGTANLDTRSFALNFEVNAVVYDNKTTTQLNQAFEDDITHSHRVSFEELKALPKWKIILQHIIRLASPIL